MTEQNSREYHQARGAKERELAKDSATPDIARIHTEMADRYDWLADNLPEIDPDLRVELKPPMDEAQQLPD